MSCPESGQIVDAPPPPGFTTPTKPIRNDGAGHAEPDADRMETASEGEGEKEFEVSTGKKRRNTGPLVYRFVKQWTTGSQAKLEPKEIEYQIYTEMKNYMHASGLKKTPGHRPKDTDIHLWKQCTKEYYNKTDAQWVRVFRCPMHYRFGCEAQVRLITGENFKRLEFAKTHDLQSHVNERSKKLTHDQIVLIHDAVIIAPNQSGTKLRRNLCQNKGSPEQFKHMKPSMLRSIQRRVKTTRDYLTMQQMEASSVPESLGDLIEWCKEHDFFQALKRHNDPRDPYCLPMYTSFVIGWDIKPARQVIQINFSNAWFLLNAVRAVETGWIVQLNGDATFGFCRADIDMIALGFCSFGGANNPVCFSYIPHQSEGEKLYTKTYYEMQSAVIALLKMDTRKECDLSKYMIMLKSRPNVQDYLAGDLFKAKKLHVDQAQCDQLPGFSCFSHEVFGFPPNICGNHITGNYRDANHLFSMFDVVGAQE